MKFIKKRAVKKYCEWKLLNMLWERIYSLSIPYPLKIKKDIDSILNKDAQIESKRIGSNNGTHEVIYESYSDLIKISHTAKNRDSFALGSIVCAQWIISQNGFFEMDDFLNDFLWVG